MFVESPWVVRGYRYGNGVGGGMAVCGVGKYLCVSLHAHITRILLTLNLGTIQVNEVFDRHSVIGRDHSLK